MQDWLFAPNQADNETSDSWSDATQLHALVEAQRLRTPDAIAIRNRGRSISYAELSRRSNQLAWYLRARGVGLETRVGLCCNRGVDLIVALLGILKSGGAYVPLDPSYPRPWTERVLADAHAAVILTESALEGRLPTSNAIVLRVDADAAAIEAQPDTPLPPLASDHALAYVLYTSGSTGAPKGVAIEHGTAVRLIRWAATVFSDEDLAGVLFATSVCFDLSVFEVFAPLSRGGTLIVAPDALHLPVLPETSLVTLVNTVPTAMTELTRRGGVPSSVRVVCLAGEPLQGRLARDVYAIPTVQRVLNLYGPTEFTTYATSLEVPRDVTGAVSIGAPLPHAHARILDARLTPVPAGEEGDLYLGGDGHARAYLDQPGLSAERFVPDPHATTPGARLYRTGDRARQRDDGTLDFLGRSDDQVKVRGFRIEPGEVEAILADHPGVVQAAIIARGEVGAERHLFAYVVPRPSLTRDARGIQELRQFLQQRLPRFMLPTQFIWMDGLPQTPSGKTDRRSLPEPNRLAPRSLRALLPPRDDDEEQILDVFREALAIELGVTDDFFALGGDSLCGMQVIARARGIFGVDLPSGVLFEAPTVEALVARARAARSRTAAPLSPIAPQDTQKLAPLSFAQHRLWLHHQRHPESTAYHLPALLRLRGPLDRRVLERALTALVDRHASLRTRYVTEEGEPCQQPDPPRLAAHTQSFGLDDLSQVGTGEREARLAALVAEENARPFDLEQGPVLRARLVRLDEEEHALLLIVHHIAADGWSLGVLTREFCALYEAVRHAPPAMGSVSEGRLDLLPPLLVQYSDFARWQRQCLNAATIEELLASARRALDEAPRKLRLPTDRPHGAASEGPSGRVPLHLERSTVTSLVALGREEGATLFMTLLAGLSAVLHPWTGQDDFLLGVPFAGRSHHALEGLIGFFANTLVVRAQTGGDPTFRALVARARSWALGAYAREDLPFEQLAGALDSERSPGRHPLVQALLALQVAPTSCALSGGLTVSLEELDPGALFIDLAVELWPDQGGLTGAVRYRRDLFDEDRIAHLAERLVALLEHASRAPDASLSTLAPWAEDAWRALDAQRAELDLIATSLLTDPMVEDCAVRVRAEGQRVAHVVAPREPSSARLGARLAQRIPARLLPVTCSLVTSLPRTSAGRLDEEALERLPVLDEELAQRWEAHLRSLPGVDNAVVLVRNVPPPFPLLHLSDVLPGWTRSGTAPTTSTLVEAETAAPITPSTPATPPAFVDGGPLLLRGDEPATLVEAVLRIAGHPDRGIVMVDRRGETHQSYAQLLERARKLLAGLQGAGLRPGDKVIFQIDGMEEQFVAFWACLLGGIAPVIVTVPASYETRSAVLGKLRDGWLRLGRPLLLASDRLAESLSSMREALGMDGLRITALGSLWGSASSARIHVGRPDDIAFLQLSSGSTGACKAIPETHRAVLRHAQGARQFHGYRTDDVFLNWLPLDHVGALLMFHSAAICVGCSQVQVHPDVIAADPSTWLDLMDAHRATRTWSPNFGYKLVVEALRDRPRGAWDLSCVRSFFNGGEQATLPVIRDFLQLLAPFGVTPSAMCPVFGMAETATGVAFCDGFDLERCVHHVAPPARYGALVDRPAGTPGTTAFVELGAPLPGAQLRIVDGEGRVLPEGFVGRLQIRGEVVLTGYLNDPRATAEALVEDGWLDTGDLGFLRHGRLTLTGREKDMIIVRGANVFCHEVEDLVGAVQGVEPGYVAACGVDEPEQGTEGLAVFFVPRDPSAGSATPIAQAVRAEVTSRLGVSPTCVIPIAPHELPRTTSGKIQRAQLKRALAAGHFDAILREMELELGGAATIPAWFHRRTFVREEPCLLAPERRGACLVFLDAHGLGDALVTALSPSGRRLIRVEPGDAFARLGEDHYRIAPHRSEDYQRLRDVLFRGTVDVLDEIVHLWTYGPAAPWPPSPAVVARESALGVTSVLLLAQALLARPSLDDPLRLLVVSSHAQPVTDDDAVACERAPLLGLLATLPEEYPGVIGQHLDLPAGAPRDQAALLLREMRVAAHDQEVAYRGGQRLVPRLTRIDFTAAHAAPVAPPFVRDGFYLVAGGLGGIGHALCEELLTRHRATLLVLGRTSPLEPGSPRGETYQALAARAERTGGSLDYAAVDVADAEAVEALVAREEARIGRKLDGILHLTGTFEERALGDETPALLAATMRPKVAGGLTLAGLLRERPAALFVTFSSVNGQFGGASAGAYAAASRFQDHLVHALRHAGHHHSYCLSWSRWDDTGMSRGYAWRDLAEARGYRALPPPLALLSLRIALHQEEPRLLLGLDERNRQIASRLASPSRPVDELTAYVVLAPGVDLPDARGLSVLDRAGAPSHCTLRQVEHIFRDASGHPDEATLRSDDHTPQRASGPAGEAPRGAVERRIAEIWREHLRVDAISAHDNFFDLGGHSLLLSAVRVRLEAAFERQVPLTEMFRHPTVRALATYLAPENDRASDEGVQDDTIDARAAKQRALQNRRRQQARLRAAAPPREDEKP
ncbi:non-ribosomal peptide synthetase [Chondromyces crocatus]|uniref:Peptide synthetase n=1 Tax=Chondromyces crocatus TaxID=52 RepID=A0A0K1E4X1_CHOCO|nr:non-ribosomal peptide synthetase [Chondromyces crocatus]AKT35904.1 peptide synthetase [Chondromyces crocatus]